MALATFSGSLEGPPWSGARSHKSRILRSAYRGRSFGGNLELSDDAGRWDPAYHSRCAVACTGEAGEMKRVSAFVGCATRLRGDSAGLQHSEGQLREIIEQTTEKAQGKIDRGLARRSKRFHERFGEAFPKPGLIKLTPFRWCWTSVKLPRGMPAAVTKRTTRTRAGSHRTITIPIAWGR